MLMNLNNGGEKERWTYVAAKVANGKRSERGTSKAVTPYKCQKHSSPCGVRQKVSQLILTRQQSVQGLESQGWTSTLLFLYKDMREWRIARGLHFLVSSTLVVGENSIVMVNKLLQIMFVFFLVILCYHHLQFTSQTKPPNNVPGTGFLFLGMHTFFLYLI